AAGRLIWRAQAAASTDEPVLVAADGLVYAGISGAANGDARTYAINAATGRQAWRTSGPAGPRPYAAGPGAVFGFVVTGGGATDVVATSAASGRTLWTHDAGPLLDNAKVGWLAYASGLVYVAAGTTENSTAGQPTVRALDARTGRRAWAVTIGTGPQEPSLAGGVLYTPDVSSATASTGRVVALHASTGARRWTSAALGGIPGLLQVTGGTVCGSALTRNLQVSIFALDSATGRRLWQREFGGLTVAATDGMVFLMPLSIGRATVTAWHARSGRPAWTQTVPAGSVAAASGSVLYLAGGRTLTAVAATTGSTLWSYQLGAGVADVAPGGHVVYALDAHGGVYALRS
ncbi:MAG TPA: PQQ-binding-like beta-propeller repeat protein, partial [Streptosporangiaceae bacterium]|nr:PQQ-binding-like beta-propeller repeat protein [Streptosporangiaceae bacterium]